MTLAIIDDIGAIAVIAVFYTDDLRPQLLLVAVGLALLVHLMHRVNVTARPLLVAAGVGLWIAVYESGVHATIAGVILGLLTPARPMQTELEADEVVDVLENRPELHADDVRDTATLIRGSVSACDRLIDALHPWTSYVIVPIFALANAGIVLSSDTFADPSAVLVGVTAGLVVGKLVGVVSFSWLAVRLGLGRLPDGTRWGHVVGCRCGRRDRLHRLVVHHRAWPSSRPISSRRQGRHPHRLRCRRRVGAVPSVSSDAEPPECRDARVIVRPRTAPRRPADRRCTARTPAVADDV